ncbi:BofC C-terminal domain-containing protein [Aneurinibacillus sp. Ricciae_BoGa-3]|uniref:BofC C-terminal domain-containing protein n=1 Tax=Aneurinibacillus sp. Ricciae_BoGa-3 TaxID=3022697 RepID=UPI00233FDED6|nr:BofC C-terminal domain-containing protein [Aneurinibacillus sp. Ricciae_BoGa-3]WCK53623.1 BofC C-terminal domain-containing protein [Aneurinibacillus sp. Ricciae_BoGa-3]
MKFIHIKGKITIWLVAILLLSGFLLVAVLQGASWIRGGADRQVNVQTVHVLLKRSYLTGETTEESRQEYVNTSEDIFKKYRNWNFVSQHGTNFTFEMKMNDISSRSKTKGYFGVNDKDELTLYEGQPEQGKVIQTFFQLDTKKLETNLPQKEIERLHKGIRITDVGEYNSIISSYSEFASGENAEG